MLQLLKSRAAHALQWQIRIYVPLKISWTSSTPQTYSSRNLGKSFWNTQGRKIPYWKLPVPYDGLWERKDVRQRIFLNGICRFRFLFHYSSRGREKSNAIVGEKWWKNSYSGVSDNVHFSRCTKYENRTRVCKGIFVQ